MQWEKLCLKCCASGTCFSECHFSYLSVWPTTESMPSLNETRPAKSLYHPSESGGSIVAWSFALVCLENMLLRKHPSAQRTFHGPFDLPLQKILDDCMLTSHKFSISTMRGSAVKDWHNYNGGGHNATGVVTATLRRAARDTLGLFSTFNVTKINP